VSTSPPRAALTTTAFGGSVANSAPDHPAGQIGERAREHDVVASGERVVDVVVVEAQYLVGGAALLRGVADPDRLHVKARKPLDDRLADRSEPDDGDGCRR